MRGCLVFSGVTSVLASTLSRNPDFRQFLLDLNPAPFDISSKTQDQNVGTSDCVTPCIAATSSLQFEF